MAGRRERAEGERRVALVPDSVEKLVSDEHEVVVEAGAGGDSYPDEDYAKAGARIAEEDAWAEADVVLKVGAPSEEEAGTLPEGCLLVCFLDPSQQSDVLERLAKRSVTVFSMAAIPRTGAAQAMDAISAPSSVAPSSSSRRCSGCPRTSAAGAPSRPQSARPRRRPRRAGRRRRSCRAATPPSRTRKRWHEQADVAARV